MSFLEVALFIILAALAGGASAFYFLRDRARADVGTGRPGPDHLASEVRAIGSQIEHALAEQRLQGETQRQVLGQKLDGVRQTVDTQQAQVQVLQSEMRHEAQRRDAEIAEIHNRLASIQNGNTLAPPPSLALEAHAPEPAVEFEDVYDATPAHPEPSPVEDMPPPVLEAPTPLPTPEPIAASEPAPAPEESLFSEFTFEDVAFEDTAPSPPALEDAPPEQPSFQNAPLSPSSFEDIALGAPIAPALEDAPPAPSVFEDAAPFLPSLQGDGSPTDDLFESWTPDASVQPSPDIATPTAALEAETTDVLEAVPVSTIQPPVPSTPPGGSAWVARPTEEHNDPVVADDLVFMPSVAPSSEAVFVEPSLDELDDIEAGLDALLPSPPPALEDAAEPAPMSTPPAPEPEPFVAPEGADDLTVITSIDEDVQRLLYLAGVTTLDQIAQWGRTSARRYSAEVSVSEETIMTQWVFEAQAALFNRYATQVGQ